MCVYLPCWRSTYAYILWIMLSHEFISSNKFVHEHTCIHPHAKQCLTVQALHGKGLACSQRSRSYKSVHKHTCIHTHTKQCRTVQAPHGTSQACSQRSRASPLQKQSAEPLNTKNIRLRLRHSLAPYWANIYSFLAQQTEEALNSICIRLRLGHSIGPYTKEYRFLAQQSHEHT